MKRIACIAAIVVAGASARPALAIDVAPAGAAGCSGCHPISQSAGTPLTRLAGRNPAEILTAMQEFRAGKRPATVMDRIAKGFSDEEVKAIADWYAAQKD